jgi:beta-galactosidase
MTLKFNKGFGLGFSTAGFQHEMGLRGSEYESDWYLWVHDPENITAGIVSGDLPENGPGYWDLFSTDHSIAQSLGMDIARLGLEWARIFPRPTFGVKVRVEEEKGEIRAVEVQEPALKEMDSLANRGAVERYSQILRDWKSRGNKLIINLYHWPLPVWLHDPIRVRKLGPDRAPSGWVDPRSVVEFAKFAAYINWKFGELADMWSTMNEPNVVWGLGYLNVRSNFPPGYLDLKSMLTARSHIMEAHARAYDVLKETGKPIGVIYALSDVQPLDESSSRAAEDYDYFSHYLFLDSLSRGTGREDLKGKLDWIGVNYYTRTIVSLGQKLAADLPAIRVVPGYGFACPPSSRSLDGRPTSEFGWEVYPEGLYNVILKLKSRYSLPMIVTENGIADSKDNWRSWYLVSHLHQIHRAISQGADVRGYLHWNLIDNYEWASGFRMKFGLVYVDLETKRRYLRPSALVFREIARNKEIPDSMEHLAGPPRL